MNKKGSSFIVGALLGGAVGYTAGILTAPKSGKETREDIKQVVSNVYSDRKELIEDLKDKTSASAERIAETVGTVAHQIPHIGKEEFAASITAKHEIPAPEVESTDEVEEEVIEKKELDIEADNYKPRADYSEFVDSIVADNKIEAANSKTIGALRSENEELRKLIDEIKGY